MAYDVLDPIFVRQVWFLMNYTIACIWAQLCYFNIYFFQLQVDMFVLPLVYAGIILYFLSLVLLKLYFISSISSSIHPVLQSSCVNI